MRNNIESFKEAFRDFPDCYTIIGGMACEILMDDAGRDFRPTKDIDMILILEADHSVEFAKAFWEYIRRGGYHTGWRNSPDVHFYRFTDPNPGFPVQIELFSRNPNHEFQIPEGIIPIHISDDVSSLSAILLDDDYYQFMLNGRESINGTTVLDAAHLIPFKMYAWLNLKDRKAAGEHVNDRDLRKHRLDVFRLLTLVPGNTEIKCPGHIEGEVRRFLAEAAMTDQALQAAGIDISAEEGMDLLKRIYL